MTITNTRPVINADDYQIGTIVEIPYGNQTLKTTITDDVHAILFDTDGNIVDLAYNADSAISIINTTPGVYGHALNPDDQNRLDHETNLRADCFGY